jgi:hypothetical protein
VAPPGTLPLPSWLAPGSRIEDPVSRRNFLTALATLAGRGVVLSSLKPAAMGHVRAWGFLSRSANQPSVVVTKYGASPTASARQNIEAFRLAEAAIPMGGQILVPPGIYDMTAAVAADAYVIATSGVEIRGEGDSTVLMTRKFDSYTGPLFGVINIGNGVRPIADISLRDFTIQGPRGHTGGTIASSAPQVVNGLCINMAVAGKAVRRVSVVGVKASRLVGCAFQVSGGDVKTGGTFDTRFENCLAFDTRNDGFNVIAGNVFRTTLNANHATDCDGFGFELAGAGTLVTNNVVQRCGQAGIGLDLNPLYGWNLRTVIKDNTIEDCYTTGYPDAPGISLGQSVKPFNVDIQHNTITRVGGNGIDGGPGGGSDIVIEGNTIQDIGKNNKRKTGIDLTSPTLLHVRSNVIVTRSSNFHMDYGIVLPGAGSETNVIGPNEITGAARAKHSIAPGTRLIL